MHSALHDLPPPAVRTSMAKFGQDVAKARRKRYLTIAMMADRMGVAQNTYRRVEKGDSAVGMGSYAMALFVLGFGEGRDEVGLQMDETRLPKRVRVRKAPALA